MRSIYLFVLAVLIGIEISVGAIVAPVIFFTDNTLGAGVLSHFQSGILMTQIFIRFGYILIGISTFVAIYNLFIFRGGRAFKVSFVCFLFSFLNLALALIFVFYFTDYIVEAQKIGESATINSQEFGIIHNASEYTLKVMMLLQFLLFFMRSFGSRNERF